MNIILNLILKPFGWIFNFFFSILAFLILVLFAAGLSFNLWFPRIVPHIGIGGGAFQLRMERSRSNIFTTNFNFYDVTVRNGDRYPIPNFVHADRASLDLLLLSLLSKRIVVEDFVLEIPQLTYVRTADGHDNLTDFLGGLSGADWLGKKDKTTAKEPRTRTIFFRHIKISVGKVIAMDFGTNSEPSKVRELSLNYEFQAEDIELSELLRRLASDLKSRGANFLVQSVMDSLSRLPGISNIAVPIMKANDMAIDVLNKGLGGGDGKKKNR